MSGKGGPAFDLFAAKTAGNKQVISADGNCKIKVLRAISSLSAPLGWRRLHGVGHRLTGNAHDFISKGMLPEAIAVDSWLLERLCRQRLEIRGPLGRFVAFRSGQ